MAEGFQTALQELLESRFKKLSPAQTRKIRAVRDLKRLQALFRAAQHAYTLDEALATLRDDQAAKKPR